MNGTTLNEAIGDYQRGQGDGTDLGDIVARHRHLGRACTRVWIAADSDLENAAAGRPGDVVPVADLTAWLIEHATPDAYDSPEVFELAARELADRIATGEDTWVGVAGEMDLRVTVLWREADAS